MFKQVSNTQQNRANLKLLASICKALVKEVKLIYPETTILLLGHWSYAELVDTPSCSFLYGTRKRFRHGQVLKLDCKTTPFLILCGSLHADDIVVKVQLSDPNSISIIVKELIKYERNMGTLARYVQPRKLLPTRQFKSRSR